MEALDINVKPTCQYAVPLWLRDEQIKLATARVKARLQPGPKRSEPIAVVCFGPSLADAWEEIRGFKYVITCSGAHRFLVERGIVPTWHCDVDPRAHKVELMGPPQKETEYLIAATCHPALFDHLDAAGAKVTLWHIFDGDEAGLRTLPPGEWAITGGSSAGLRAMSLAAFLGFKDLHVFGMDGCEGATGKHAAAHPNQAKGSQPVTYKGKEYGTTPALLMCAQQTFHELNQLPAVKATFHGEGLVQAMARDYVRQEVAVPLWLQNTVGIVKPELISATYRELNTRLHRENLAYGVGGSRHAETVKKLAAHPSVKSVLDYGCGKGYLAKELPFPVWEYDPAIPGKDASPRAADLVVCTDVLEHIEPDRLKFVLGDLARCVKQMGYFTIATGPSMKALADGRNAHLIQKNAVWWKNRLSGFFQVAMMKEARGELYVVVGPKNGAPKKTKLVPAQAGG